MKIALPLQFSPFFAALRVALETVQNTGYGEGVSAPVVGDSFVVQHDLGAVPEAITVSTVADARTWWTEADRKLWTANAVRLRCSAAVVRVQVRAESRKLEG